MKTKIVRENYLDIAKGFGIMLVVLGHLQLDSSIKNFIYSFHMPFFFYVGGVLYKNKAKVPFNKMKYFLQNYFVFGLIFISLMGLKENTVNLDMFYNLILSNPISIYNIEWFGVFWFLLAYLAVILITQVKLFSSVLVSFILFIFLYYIQDTSAYKFILMLPLCIAPAMLLLLFFNIGKYNDKVVKYYSTMNLILVLTVFLALNVINIYFYNGFDEKIINYGNLILKPNILLVLSVALTGIVSIIYISIFVSAKLKLLANIMTYYGRNTMPIFIWHLFILALVHSVLYRISGDEGHQHLLVFQLLKFIFCVFVITIGIKVFNKIKSRYL